jgi:hypothetical protein
VQPGADVFGGGEGSATRQSGDWGVFSKEGDGWKEGKPTLYRPVHRTSLRGDDILCSYRRRETAGRELYCRVAGSGIGRD